MCFESWRICIKMFQISFFNVNLKYRSLYMWFTVVIFTNNSIRKLSDLGLKNHHEIPEKGMDASSKFWGSTEPFFMEPAMRLQLMVTDTGTSYRSSSDTSWKIWISMNCGAKTTMPHTTEKFPKRFFSKRSELNWPVRSDVWTPCVFFLGGFL